MSKHGITFFNNLTFTAETVNDWLRDGAPLFKLHYEEVAKDKDTMVLGADEDVYRAGGAKGTVVPILARDRGKLVGYMVWFFYRHPHYKTVLVAQDDVHYMLPEYRRGMNGYILLRKAIDFAKARGAQYCYIREKVGHEHPAIMKRLGLTPMDVTYSMKL